MTVYKKGSNEKDAKRPASSEPHRYLSGATLNPAAEWGIGSCDERTLADCVELVLAAGDAITFSQPRAGRAVFVTVYSGDERQRFDARSVEDLNTILADISHVASQHVPPEVKLRARTASQ